MQFSTTLAILFSVYSTVQAACYGPGTSGNKDSYGWEGQQDHAKWHAYRACKGWEENGVHEKGAYENTYFRPDWETGLPATVCVNGLTTHYRATHFIFQFYNHGPGKTLNPDDCVRVLNAEIDGCGNGGETYYQGWFSVRADPQDGWC